MLSHYEVYVTFQGIEHQLQENILHHFLCYSFLKSLHEIEKFLLFIQNYLLKAFDTLFIHKLFKFR